MKMSVYQQLHQGKEADLDPVVQAVLAAGVVPEELLTGITASDKDYRYNCFEVLHRVSERQPALLYPVWDTFVELLDSPNAFFRSIGLRLLALLTGADDEGRFDPLFDRYFALLDDEKVMVARYLVQSAGTIARWKPHLQERITEKLLDVDRTHHTESRKALIKADVITYFQSCFAPSPEKQRMLAFAESMLESSSPKARKTARAFLDEHGQVT